MVVRPRQVVRQDQGVIGSEMELKEKFMRKRQMRSEPRKSSQGKEHAKEPEWMNLKDHYPATAARHVAQSQKKDMIYGKRMVGRRSSLLRLKDSKEVLLDHQFDITCGLLLSQVSRH
jgi:hypothetical protein